MKKNSYIVLCAALALFASCSSDEEVLDAPVVIRLSTDIDDAMLTDTRAVAIATPGTAAKPHNWSLQDTQFLPTAASGAMAGIANNSIAVYVEDTGDSSHQPLTTYTNALKYTPNGSGGLSVADAQKQYYPSNNQAVNIYAYYPGQSTELVPVTARNRTVGAIAFTVQENQESLADYAKSDLMYGTPNKYGSTNKTNPIPRSTQKVNLNFQHLLSKVTITVKTDGHFQANHLAGAVVTIGGINRLANFNFTSGDISVPSGNAAGNYYRSGQSQNQTIRVMTLRESTPSPDDNGGYVDPANASHAGQHGSAIVVPQIIAAGSEFIKVALTNGGSYIYKPASAITLAPKTAYNITITLTNTEIQLTSTITTWGGETTLTANDAIQY